MKKDRLIVLSGNCLFHNHKDLVPSNKDLFFLAEDYGLCTKYNYHKHKLILILASMRSYRDELQKKYSVEYFELNSDNKNSSYQQKILNTINAYEIKKVVIYDNQSRYFITNIEKICRAKRLELTIKPSPMFLTSRQDFTEYRSSYKRLLMNDFYIWQRKRLNIMVDEKGKPVSEKWNYDKDNRKKLPKGIVVPNLPRFNKTKHVLEVSDLTNRLFPNNPGSTENFFLPTTRKRAFEWLNDFLEYRLIGFGPYEDAISKEYNFIYHSLLSPLLNIGLLIPSEVIKSTLDYCSSNKVPIQSIEGFIRQIIGWREFIKCVYDTEDLIGNYFKHNNKLNSKWYKGDTGVSPLDYVIDKVIKYGYCHHIERLMVLSNIMLLSEINPDEVYKWFMEMFVDSYDWVMVPNVYGMGQFADGGKFATKPYISGSSYILKMSDFKRGEWCEIWDGLYWRFIEKNKNLFLQNKRMSLMVKLLQNIEQDKKQNMIKKAESFIEEVVV